MPPLWLVSLLAFGAPTADADDIVIPPQYEIGPSYFCEMDRDCTRFTERPYCHPDTMECSECAEDSHCDDGWICDQGWCVDVCVVDLDCDGVDGLDVCDPDSGSCVDCLTADQCDEGQLCSFSSCVDCVEDDDCDEGQFCSLGSCYGELCQPGALLCHVGDVGECGPRGDSVTIIEDCGEPCVDDGSGPYCPSGGPSTTGGPSDDSGGTSPTAGDDSRPIDDTGAATGGTGGTGTSEQDGLTRSGCGCRSDHDAPIGWSLALLGLAALRRRRR